MMMLIVAYGVNCKWYLGPDTSIFAKWKPLGAVLSGRAIKRRRALNKARTIRHYKVQCPALILLATTATLLLQLRFNHYGYDDLDCPSILSETRFDLVTSPTALFLSLPQCGCRHANCCQCNHYQDCGYTSTTTNATRGTHYCRKCL